jgi:SAM-dependent methyltransferase
VTPRNVIFDEHHRRYEEWFASHTAAYCSELLAVRALLPCGGDGVEIGVGTGRFAAPLGVRVGVDPSAAMLEHARMRGISVVLGVAERLPFAAASFDYGLIVTTLCFVDDAGAMLREARRVIKPDGCLVVGFVDRESSLGQEYLAHQAENVFYREATFYSSEEVEGLLRDCGFPCQVRVQTLSRPLSEIREIEPLQPGRGIGAFVVIRGMAAWENAGSKNVVHSPVERGNVWLRRKEAERATKGPAG